MVRKIVTIKHGIENRNESLFKGKEEHAHKNDSMYFQYISYDTVFRWFVVFVRDQFGVDCDVLDNNDAISKKDEITHCRKNVGRFDKNILLVEDEEDIHYPTNVKKEIPDLDKNKK